MTPQHCVSAYTPKRTQGITIVVDEGAGALVHLKIDDTAGVFELSSGDVRAFARVLFTAAHGPGKLLRMENPEAEAANLAARAVELVQTEAILDNDAAFRLKARIGEMIEKRWGVR